MLKKRGRQFFKRKQLIKGAKKLERREKNLQRKLQENFITAKN